MNISYRVRSLASAEQPTSWANRSAVASGAGSFERASDASHPAGRPGYVCCMDVFLPNYPAPVRPALSAAPGLFGGVPVFQSRASGDPAPVRSTGMDVSSLNSPGCRPLPAQASARPGLFERMTP